MIELWDNIETLKQWSFILALMAVLINIICIIQSAKSNAKTKRSKVYAKRVNFGLFRKNHYVGCVNYSPLLDKKNLHVNWDKYFKISLEIKRNLIKSDQKYADMIVDLLKHLREELSKPNPEIDKLSKLSKCLSLIMQMLTFDNCTPELSSSLYELSNFIRENIYRLRKLNEKNSENKN